ncbi:hypothetical protein [Devosia nitrariae]|uniref:CBS domain-containing protein n=1 Tax=Devosia nitrariae TaxID=2071872 RepID=A0ABQ5W2C2_9HYPH|nr:hypothetical protein [Devosia nitrariae]GLQ53988.1 hypothetical protein GCM10010862_12470 [Devosia nitrariae]
MIPEIVSDAQMQVRTTGPVTEVIDALSNGASTVSVSNEEGAEVGSIASQQIIDALQSRTDRAHDA